MSRELDEKVAVALGWRLVPIDESPLDFCREGATHVWMSPEGSPWCVKCDDLPDWSTDWAHAGPLIERFSLSVIKQTYYTGEDDLVWRAWWQTRDDSPEGWEGLEEEIAANPIEAICQLIVRLHKEGKLNA